MAKYEDDVDVTEIKDKPMMVMDDKLTGCLKAHRVDGKGRTDTWIAKRMVTDITDIGYGGQSIVATCDQESPLRAIQDDIIRARSDGMTVPKHNYAGDSNSNGRIGCKQGGDGAGANPLVNGASPCEGQTYHGA